MDNPYLNLSKQIEELKRSSKSGLDFDTLDESIESSNRGLANRIEGIDTLVALMVPFSFAMGALPFLFLPKDWAELVCLGTFMVLFIIVFRKPIFARTGIKRLFRRV